MGKITPVIYYDELPTDGYDKVTANLKQHVEVPICLFDKDVTQLTLVYPYLNTNKPAEKFKI